jgi:hypothetical protein
MNTEIWECRLCGTKPMNHEELIGHLDGAHGFTKEGRDALGPRLHAGKDYPEYSVNTLGWYDGEQLVCLCVQVRERAADDPMRFED